MSVLSGTRRIRPLLAAVLLLAIASAAAACTGSEGEPGPQGAPGPAGPPGPSGPAAEEAASEADAGVAVAAEANAPGAPRATVILSASVDAADGSTVTGYRWTQLSGVPATVSGAESDTATVTLGAAAAYRDALIATLPPLDRFMVLPINPHELEEAERVTFEVTVTTSSGTYSDTVDVDVQLPYAVSSGLRNVPTGLPVLLQGKQQGFYVWKLQAPDGSDAELDRASTRNPSFTPDAAGKYTLSELTSGATLEVFAGSWVGAISGIDENGRPLAADCTMCHDGGVAPDNFTAWKESGHAEIFTSNLNTSTHYGEGCFACHTVGFDPTADNDGFDEAADYGAFLLAELVNSPDAQNWTTVLAEYSGTAALANIQCENCHGPNADSTLHRNGELDAARISLAAENCATCHGEPARHGRYQQWEESAHASYDLAISRGTNASCARCHSGQGFLAWLPQLEAGNPGNIEAEITWTADDVVPQTCAVCHDPHGQGTTSGEPNTATVRVTGSTSMLPSGFKALGVGRGAICITCHNTRNGAHNDAVTGELDDRAPHTAAQGDVLMGENAYFVSTGERSPHSLLTDTCAACHMELTDPPAEFSYNLSGTNHTFEASVSICSQCHGGFTAAGLMSSTEAMLHELKAVIEAAIAGEIAAQTGAGGTVTLVGAGEDGADVAIGRGSVVEAVELTEYHGRSAMNLTVDGESYQHVQLASGTKVGGGTLLTSGAGQLIARAAWNYFLIHGDGSEGIHNPSFAANVLTASINALR